MKRIKILLLFISLLFLNACSVQINNEMNVNENGNFSYEIMAKFDKQLVSNLIKMSNIEINDSIENTSISDEEITKFLNDNYIQKMTLLEGFTKDELLNEKYIIYKFTYKVDDINTISSKARNKITINDYSNSKKLMNQKLFYKNRGVYQANFEYDLSKEIEGDSLIDFDNIFTIKLPIKAITSNANKVSDDGKTLTWILQEGKINSISFSFSLDRVNEIIIITLLVLIILLVILLLLDQKYKIFRRQTDEKRERNKNRRRTKQRKIRTKNFKKNEEKSNKTKEFTKEEENTSRKRSSKEKSKKKIKKEV